MRILLFCSFLISWPLALSADPLRVVATTGMIADAARAVGGDHVTVTALMGSGVDPHSFRQTRSDIVLLREADLVLWHGLNLEAQLAPLMADLAQNQPVLALAEAVDHAKLIASTEEGEAFDPHIWMDPMLWGDLVIALRDALIAADPENGDAFRASADAYLTELAALAGYSAQTLGTIPEEARVLVTAHDAFGYFGRAYGFEVLGIQGLSTESEAGLQDIATLVDTLVARGIQAVFVETSVTDRNVLALIEGAAAKGHQVTIGGALFSDAMGVEGSYEGTYLGMIDHNITTIARALGGDAPALGRIGQLSESDQPS